MMEIVKVDEEKVFGGAVVQDDGKGGQLWGWLGGDSAKW